MKIADYKATLEAGKTIEIGESADFEEMTVDPPSADDVDQGFMYGTTAAETIELHRALTAWLILHKRMHRTWHRHYRKTNPGLLREPEEES